MPAMRAHISMVSSNIKTGPIPVSSTCSSSCPPSCPFKGRAGGCYGGQGNVLMVWNRVDGGKIGKSWDDFCSQVAGMPKNQLWRHNQVGDLPGRGGLIDGGMLRQLVDANQGKRGFTYTHYDPFKGDNAKLIELANKDGFTINLSADCLAHADKLARLEIAPVVCVLPTGFEGNETRTPEGRRVLVCLAERVEYMTCSICKVCLRADRLTVIGFRAHGSCKYTVDRKNAQLSRKHREITPEAVRFQVSQGKETASAVARALGYRSMCGETLKKVKELMSKNCEEKSLFGIDIEGEV